MAVAASLLFLGLLLLKVVVSASTILVFVGMPLAAVAWPVVPWVARAAMRAFAVCLLVPALWALCFAAGGAAMLNAISFNAPSASERAAAAAGGDRAAVRDAEAADASRAGGDARRGAARRRVRVPRGQLRRRVAGPRHRAGSTCRAGPAGSGDAPAVAAGEPDRDPVAHRGDARGCRRQRRGGGGAGRRWAAAGAGSADRGRRGWVCGRSERSRVCAAADALRPTPRGRCRTGCRPRASPAASRTSPTRGSRRSSASGPAPCRPSRPERRSRACPAARSAGSDSSSQITVPARASISPTRRWANGRRRSARRCARSPPPAPTCAPRPSAMPPARSRMASTRAAPVRRRPAIPRGSQRTAAAAHPASRGRTAIRAARPHGPPATCDTERAVGDRVLVARRGSSAWARFRRGAAAAKPAAGAGAQEPAAAARAARPQPRRTVPERIRRLDRAPRSRSSRVEAALLGLHRRADRRGVRRDHARLRVGEVRLARCTGCCGAMSGAYIAALPVIPVFVASQTEFDLAGLVAGALRWRRLDGPLRAGAGQSATGYVLRRARRDRPGRRRRRARARSAGAVGASRSARR